MYKYKINPETRKIYAQIDWRCQLRVPTFMDKTQGKVLKTTLIEKNTLECVVSRDSKSQKNYSTVIRLFPAVRTLLNLKPYDWFEIFPIESGYIIRKAEPEEVDFESEE